MADGLAIISAGDDRAIYMAILSLALPLSLTVTYWGKWSLSHWGSQLNDGFGFRVSITLRALDVIWEVQTDFVGVRFIIAMTRSCVVGHE
jgi:hypothetical protein